MPEFPESYNISETHKVDDALLGRLDEFPPLFGYLAAWTYLNNETTQPDGISEKSVTDIHRFQAQYKFLYERPVAFARAASQASVYAKDPYASQYWSPNGIYVVKRSAIEDMEDSLEDAAVYKVIHVPVNFSKKDSSTMPTKIADDDEEVHLPSIFLRRVATISIGEATDKGGFFYDIEALDKKDSRKFDTRYKQAFTVIKGLYIRSNYVEVAWKTSVSGRSMNLVNLRGTGAQKTPIEKDDVGEFIVQYERLGQDEKGAELDMSYATITKNAYRTLLRFLAKSPDSEKNIDMKQLLTFARADTVNAYIYLGYDATISGALIPPPPSVTGIPGIIGLGFQPSNAEEIKNGLHFGVIKTIPLGVTTISPGEADAGARTVEGVSLVMPLTTLGKPTDGDGGINSTLISSRDSFLDPAHCAPIDGLFIDMISHPYSGFPRFSFTSTKTDTDPFYKLVNQYVKQHSTSRSVEDSDTFEFTAERIVREVSELYTPLVLDPSESDTMDKDIIVISRILSNIRIVKTNVETDIRKEHEIPTERPTGQRDLWAILKSTWVSDKPYKVVPEGIVYIPTDIPDSLQPQQELEEPDAQIHKPDLKEFRPYIIMWNNTEVSMYTEGEGLTQSTYGMAALSVQHSPVRAHSSEEAVSRRYMDASADSIARSFNDYHLGLLDMIKEEWPKDTEEPFEYDWYGRGASKLDFGNPDIQSLLGYMLFSYTNGGAFYALKGAIDPQSGFSEPFIEELLEDVDLSNHKLQIVVGDAGDTGEGEDEDEEEEEEEEEEALPEGKSGSESMEDLDADRQEVLDLFDVVRAQLKRGGEKKLNNRQRMMLLAVLMDIVSSAPGGPREMMDKFHPGWKDETIISIPTETSAGWGVAYGRLANMVRKRMKDFTLSVVDLYTVGGLFEKVIISDGKVNEYVGKLRAYIAPFIGRMTDTYTLSKLQGRLTTLAHIIDAANNESRKTRDEFVVMRNAHFGWDSFLKEGRFEKEDEEEDEDEIEEEDEEEDEIEDEGEDEEDDEEEGEDGDESPGGEAPVVIEKEIPVPPRNEDIDIVAAIRARSIPVEYVVRAFLNYENTVVTPLMDAHPELKDISENIIDLVGSIWTGLDKLFIEDTAFRGITKELAAIVSDGYEELEQRLTAFDSTGIILGKNTLKSRITEYWQEEEVKTRQSFIDKTISPVVANLGIDVDLSYEVSDLIRKSPKKALRRETPATGFFPLAPGTQFSIQPSRVSNDQGPGTTELLRKLYATDSEYDKIDWLFDTVGYEQPDNVLGEAATLIGRVHKRLGRHRYEIIRENNKRTVAVFLRGMVTTLDDRRVKIRKFINSFGGKRAADEQAYLSVLEEEKIIYTLKFVLALYELGITGDGPHYPLVSVSQGQVLKGPWGVDASEGGKFPIRIDEYKGYDEYTKSTGRKQGKKPSTRRSVGILASLDTGTHTAKQLRDMVRNINAEVLTEASIGYTEDDEKQNFLALGKKFPPENPRKPFFKSNKRKLIEAIREYYTKKFGQPLEQSQQEYENGELDVINPTYGYTRRNETVLKAIVLAFRFVRMDEIYTNGSIHDETLKDLNLRPFVFTIPKISTIVRNVLLSKHAMGEIKRHYEEVFVKATERLEALRQRKKDLTLFLGNRRDGLFFMAKTLKREAFKRLTGKLQVELDLLHKQDASTAVNSGLIVQKEDFVNGLDTMLKNIFRMQDNPRQKVSPAKPLNPLNPDDHGWWMVDLREPFVNHLFSLLSSNPPDMFLCNLLELVGADGGKPADLDAYCARYGDIVVPSRRQLAAIMRKEDGGHIAPIGASLKELSVQLSHLTGRGFGLHRREFRNAKDVAKVFADMVATLEPLLKEAAETPGALSDGATKEDTFIAFIRHGYSVTLSRTVANPVRTVLDPIVKLMQAEQKEELLSILETEYRDRGEPGRYETPDQEVIHFLDNLANVEAITARKTIASLVTSLGTWAMVQKITDTYAKVLDKALGSTDNPPSSEQREEMTNDVQALKAFASVLRRGTDSQIAQAPEEFMIEDTRNAVIEVLARGPIEYRKQLANALGNAEDISKLREYFGIEPEDVQQPRDMDSAVFNTSDANATASATSSPRPSGATMPSAAIPTPVTFSPVPAEVRSPSSAPTSPEVPSTTSATTSPGAPSTKPSTPSAPTSPGAPSPEPSPSTSSPTPSPKVPSPTPSPKVPSPTPSKDKGEEEKEEVEELPGEGGLAKEDRTATPLLHNSIESIRRIISGDSSDAYPEVYDLRRDGLAVMVNGSSKKAFFTREDIIKAPFAGMAVMAGEHTLAFEDLAGTAYVSITVVDMPLQLVTSGFSGIPFDTFVGVYKMPGSLGFGPTNAIKKFYSRYSDNSAANGEVFVPKSGVFKIDGVPEFSYNLDDDFKRIGLDSVQYAYTSFAVAYISMNSPAVAHMGFSEGASSNEGTEFSGLIALSNVLIGTLPGL